MTPRDTARQLRADPFPETIRSAADTLDALADRLDVASWAAASVEDATTLADRALAAELRSLRDSDQRRRAAP